MDALEDRTLRWGIGIVALVVLVAGTFVISGQPIVGNVVSAVRGTESLVPSSCTVDLKLVENCREECGSVNRCDAYRISCGTPNPLQCICVSC